MTRIKNWIAALIGAVLLPVLACGGTAEEYEQIAQQGYVYSPDAGGLGEAESAITTQTTRTFGYNQFGGNAATRACETAPAFPQFQDCVFPLSKLRLICIQNSTFTPPDATTVRQRVDAVIARLNSVQAAQQTGYTFQRVVATTCTNINSNIIVRGTTFVDVGINRYMTVGCDSATAPVNTSMGLVRDCTLNGVYFNPTQLKADLIARALPQSNPASWERVIGHGIVVASGWGAQDGQFGSTASQLYSWRGDTASGSIWQGSPAGVVPVTGFAGSGVSSQDLCAARLFSPLPVASFAFSATGCP